MESEGSVKTISSGDPAIQAKVNRLLDLTQELSDSDVGLGLALLKFASAHLQDRYQAFAEILPAPSSQSSFSKGGSA